MGRTWRMLWRRRACVSLLRVKLVGSSQFQLPGRKCVHKRVTVEFFTFWTWRPWIFSSRKAPFLVGLSLSPSSLSPSSPGLGLADRPTDQPLNRPRVLLTKSARTSPESRPEKSPNRPQNVAQNPSRFTPSPSPKRHLATSVDCLFEGSLSLQMSGRDKKGERGSVSASRPARPPGGRADERGRTGPTFSINTEEGGGLLFSGFLAWQSSKTVTREGGETTIFWGRGKKNKIVCGKKVSGVFSSARASSAPTRVPQDDFEVTSL